MRKSRHSKPQTQTSKNALQHKPLQHRQGTPPPSLPSLAPLPPCPLIPLSPCPLVPLPMSSPYTASPCFAVLCCAWVLGLGQALSLILSLSLSVCLSVSLSLCLSVSLSLCLSVSLSLCLSLSVSLSLCLSVCLSLSRSLSRSLCFALLCSRHGVKAGPPPRSVERPHPDILRGWAWLYRKDSQR